MITNAILNFMFGVTEMIFKHLPIPGIPDWVDDVQEFLFGWIAKGCHLFTWIFPSEYYVSMINILSALLTVRVTYDLYHKFHKFKHTPSI